METYADEINLRPFITALLRKWWVICLSAGVFALIGFIYFNQQPVLYRAKANAILPGTEMNLEIAEDFESVSSGISLKNRIETYIEIALSDYVAGNTYNKLEKADIFGVSNGSLKGIKSAIKIESTGISLSFVATANDPKTAALIANTYAEEAIKAINDAYRSNAQLEQLEYSREEAKSDFETAQEDLESFIRENSNLHYRAQIETQLMIVESYTKTLNTELSESYGRILDLERSLDDALLLENIIKTGNLSTSGTLGNSLAILNTHLLPVSENALGQGAIQLQIEDISELLNDTDLLITDIERMISILYDSLDKENQSLSIMLEEISSGDVPDQITEAITEIQAIEAEFEGVSQEKLNLETKRSLNWDIYQSLDQKIEEIKASTPTDYVIVLASPAIPPEDHLSTNTIRNLLIAGAAGFFLSAFVIIITTWWKEDST